MFKVSTFDNLADFESPFYMSPVGLQTLRYFHNDFIFRHKSTELTYAIIDPN